MDALRAAFQSAWGPGAFHPVLHLHRTVSPRRSPSANFNGDSRSGRRQSESESGQHQRNNASSSSDNDDDQSSAEGTSSSTSTASDTTRREHSTSTDTDCDSETLKSDSPRSDSARSDDSSASRRRGGSRKKKSGTIRPDAVDNEAPSSQQQRVVDEEKRVPAFVPQRDPHGDHIYDQFSQMPFLFPTLEGFMWYGICACVNVMLQFATLPVKIATMPWSVSKRDVLGLLLVFAGMAPLTFFERDDEGYSFLFSYCYHTIRGTNILKIYAIFNMLDIAERLVASFESDVLEALWISIGRSDSVLDTVKTFARRWRAGKTPIPATATANDSSHHGHQHNHQKHNHSSATSAAPIGVGGSSHEGDADGPPHFFFSLWLLLMSFAASAFHAFILILMVVTINVTLNSDNYSLFALLISNNFIEIKSHVFKKHKAEGLFQIACGDIVERVQQLTFVATMLIHHAQSEGFGTVQPLDLIAVYVCEIFIDFTKHFFIARFNRIPLSVYSHYLEAIQWDVARAEFSRVMFQRLLRTGGDVAQRFFNAAKEKDDAARRDDSARSENKKECTAPQNEGSRSGAAGGPMDSDGVALSSRSTSQQNDQCDSEPESTREFFTPSEAPLAPASAGYSPSATPAVHHSSATQQDTLSAVPSLATTTSATAGAGTPATSAAAPVSVHTKLTAAEEDTQSIPTLRLTTPDTFLPNPIRRLGFVPFPYVAIVMWSARSTLLIAWERSLWLFACICFCAVVAKMLVGVFVNGRAARFAVKSGRWDAAIRYHEREFFRWLSSDVLHATDEADPRVDENAPHRRSPPMLSLTRTEHEQRRGRGRVHGFEIPVQTQPLLEVPHQSSADLSGSGRADRSVSGVSSAAAIARQQHRLSSGERSHLLELLPPSAAAHRTTIAALLHHSHNAAHAHAQAQGLLPTLQSSRTTTPAVSSIGVSQPSAKGSTGSHDLAAFSQPPPANDKDQLAAMADTPSPDTAEATIPRAENENNSEECQPSSRTADPPDAKMDTPPPAGARLRRQTARKPELEGGIVIDDTEQNHDTVTARRNGNDNHDDDESAADSIGTSPPSSQSFCTAVSVPVAPLEAPARKSATQPDAFPDTARSFGSRSESASTPGAVPSPPAIETGMPPPRQPSTKSDSAAAMGSDGSAAGVVIPPGMTPQQAQQILDYFSSMAAVPTPDEVAAGHSINSENRAPSAGGGGGDGRGRGGGGGSGGGILPRPPPLSAAFARQAPHLGPEPDGFSPLAPGVLVTAFPSALASTVMPALAAERSTGSRNATGGPNAAVTAALPSVPWRGPAQPLVINRPPSSRTTSRGGGPNRGGGPTPPVSTSPTPNVTPALGFSADSEQFEGLRLPYSALESVDARDRVMKQCREDAAAAASERQEQERQQELIRDRSTLATASTSPPSAPGHVGHPVDRRRISGQQIASTDHTPNALSPAGVSGGQGGPYGPMYVEAISVDPKTQERVHVLVHKETGQVFRAPSAAAWTSQVLTAAPSGVGHQASVPDGPTHPSGPHAHHGARKGHGDGKKSGHDRTKSLASMLDGVYSFQNPTLVSDT